jgi:hypothetical protein
LSETALSERHLLHQKHVFPLCTLHQPRVFCSTVLAPTTFVAI